MPHDGFVKCKRRDFSVFTVGPIVKITAPALFFFIAFDLNTKGGAIKILKNQMCTE